MRPCGTGMPSARRKALDSGSESAALRRARAAAISAPASFDEVSSMVALAPASIIDAQHDLAELLRLLEVAMRLRRLLQREHAIDDRLEPAVAEQRHHRFEIVLGRAVGADDL